MKFFDEYTEAEQMAIVAAAATSWSIPPGGERNRLWAAFHLINPQVDLGDGDKSTMLKRQALAIRELVDCGLDDPHSLNSLRYIRPPLDPLQLITTDEDYQVTLSMQLNRAEAKILYALLQRRIQEDTADRDLFNEAHKTLASKLYYYITDTPLP